MDIRASDVTLLAKLCGVNTTALVMTESRACAAAADLVKVRTDSELRAALTRLSSTPVLFVTSSIAALRQARHLRPNLAAVLWAGGDADPAACSGLTRYHHVNNPDGTIRWFFEANEKEPLFLSLYNAQTIKAALFCAATRLLFRAGRKDLISSGSFYATLPASDLLAPFLGRGERFEHAAFFTGTVGEDRKVTVALARAPGRRPEAFLKIPLTDAAACLVRNEAAALTALPRDLNSFLETPAAEIPAAERLSLLVSNLSSVRTRSTVRFTRAHARALHGLYRSGTRRSPVCELPFVDALGARIDALAECRSPTNGLAPEVFQALGQLLVKGREHAARAGHAPVVTGWGHRDFTPLNSFIGEPRLRVYDWELAGPDVPILHDLFHYIFQAQVLVAHADHRAVLAAIRDALRLPEVKKIVGEHGVDVNLHLGLYLLHQASLYARKFASQDRIHEQGKWLMTCWRGALDGYLASDGTLL